jgi:predicted transcriptional regulator
VKPRPSGGAAFGLTKLFVDNDEAIRHNRAMASKPPRPTEAELSILRVLWARGAQSVREVQRALNETKPTGYTTALKLMQIMTEKGLVERDETKRPLIYKPRYSQQQTRAAIAGRLAAARFRRIGERTGPASPLDEKIVAGGIGSHRKIA